MTMHISDMNLWGVVPLALLLVAAVAVFWLVDRKTSRRVGRALLMVAVQLAVVGGYVWGLQRFSSLWTDLLWLLVMSLAAAMITQSRRSTPSGFHLLVVAAALCVACGLPSWCLAVALPGRLFVPVAGVMMGPVALTADKALSAYERSLLHTQAHIRFLLANGASRMESLMPSVRRSLRAAVLAVVRTLLSPVIVAMPPLVGGLLLGGIPVGTALLVALLFVAAFLSAAILSAVVQIALVEHIRGKGGTEAKASAAE